MEERSENTTSTKPQAGLPDQSGRLKLGLGMLPSWLTNKYLLTGVFFVIWMLFFDPKDILSNIERRDKLNELQNSEQHFKTLIKESNQELDLLKNNAQSIEKYAREKYMMKKDNEDLFIVVNPVENK